MIKNIFRCIGICLCFGVGAPVIDSGIPKDPIWLGAYTAMIVGLVLITCWLIISLIENVHLGKPRDY